MKKIVALMLALVMCFMAFNVTGFAAAADTEITVDASEIMPVEDDGFITLTSQAKSMDVYEGEELYFTFTTTVAGDYRFNFTNLNAYVYLTDEDADVWLYEQIDTLYQDFSAGGEWLVRESLVFNLQANSTYYIYVENYDAATVTLSVTKSDFEVVNIVPEKVPTGFHSTHTLQELKKQDFGWKLYFADGTSDFYNLYSVEKYGYIIPELNYVGKIINMHDEEHFGGGKQPIQTTYNGITTTTYIQVLSFNKWLSEEGARVFAENQHLSITYEGDGTYTYYWRIKMTQSGYFAVYRNNSDAFGTNFDYYSIEIIDKNNCVLPFNESLGAWPMIEGEEYTLSFQYEYDDYYTWNDIEFWFQKEANLKSNGWVLVGDRWYIFENNKLVKNAWRKDSKGWVYCGADGAMKTNAWVKDSKGWCYVGASGYAVTNTWKQDSKGWIYLDGNGSMTKNKWVQTGGKWYYCDANGYMVTNKWSKDSKGWVYVGADGAMKTNAWVRDSKGWCYVGANGYAVTNTWKQDSVGWVYLDKNGSMTKNAWVKTSGKWYYCDGNGYMVANKMLYIGGKYYNFNASGVCTNP